MTTQRFCRADFGLSSDLLVGSPEETTLKGRRDLGQTSGL